MQDTSFHVSFMPAHRRFLRLRIPRRPFRLALAPRTFSMSVEAALAALRSRRLRVSAYLDDYLLCSPTQEQAERNVLRFKINHKNSCLVHTQRMEYLGIKLDSLSHWLSLSDSRIMSFRQCLSLFNRGEFGHAQKVSECWG